MKQILLCIALLLPFIRVLSQVTDAEKQMKTQKVDSVYGWKKGGLINIGISQTSLTNWAAGGQSSFSGNGLLNLFAHNKMEKGLWENYLDIGYGMMKQGKDDLQKTDDKIEFTSKYGRNLTEKWYLAGLFNFKTQFADGYNYPNDSVKISDFLSPGYFLGAIGADYRPGENFTVFIAPLTGRFTVVTDQELSDAGAFGVNPGDNVYSEFGAYIRLFLKQAIMKNITFQTKLDLFSNYLNNPQNVDVNWDVLLSLKVNEFISTTLSTNLIYDDDIKISFDNDDDGVIDEKGPRVQFKEILAVGLSFKF